ncbi:MAG: response regulator [Thermodesulfobacteriota bacterium]|nr:response regulator [Thermodesulfobacteriota bacterium]
MKDEILRDLLRALDVVVMEMTQKGAFALIVSDVPEWFNSLFEDMDPDVREPYPTNVFTFLGNFLEEAKAWWEEGVVGTKKSGIWIKTDEAGDEYLFEATALNTPDRNLLLIERGNLAVKEKQRLIQKGRDLALNYHTLERLEKELEIARDKLEMRVKERTADLEAANRRLARELEERERIERERTELARHLQRAQKMEAIGTLAGGIAHDFNNILSAVLGFTEMSLNLVDQGSKVQNNLQQVLMAANRAKNLVRQILTFSHQAKEECKPIQVKETVEEALELIRASLPATIEIRQDLQSEACILADSTQLHQVIMNLCANAGHAMREKGGILTVGILDKKLPLEAASAYPDLRPGHHVLITVKDTGHGMTPEIIERIYDPFFTTKGKGMGTGMGLSVVHGIVKSYNGTVTVESKPDQGSEFQLLIPAFEESAITEISQGEIPKGGKERILFVDDDPLQTEMTTEMLQHLGYEVVTANDSARALELFSGQMNNLDLVITDVSMPTMNGKVLAQKILRIRQDMPIILCSGYSEDISPTEASALGISDYLMKPMGMHDLAKSIRRVLDAH